MKKHKLKPMDIRYVASFLDGEGSIIMGKCMKFNPVAKKDTIVLLLEWKYVTLILIS